MTDSSAAALCRLTVRTPGRSIDLAVPSDVPVADLLPALLRYAGDETEEKGLEHDGWILQRLGSAPFDEEASLEAAGLSDGDVLYLRPRTEAMPEVQLDDLIDGIATTMHERHHGWSTEASRRLLYGVTGALLAAVLVVLGWPGEPAGSSAAAAAVIGLVLLAGSASASRAMADATAAAVLGFAATPYLAFAGWLMPGVGMHGNAVPALGARLLAAGSAAAGSAVLALAVGGVFTPWFVALALVGAVTTAAGLVMGFMGLGLASTASLVAATAVVLGGTVPSVAFRMSGMRMPPMPTNPQQLQEGIEPHSMSDVATRTEIASTWMTALYAATGVLCTVSVLVLASSPKLPFDLTSCTLSLLLLLHGRSLVNVAQRLVLVIPGVIGFAGFALTCAESLAPTSRLVLVAALISLTAVVTIAAWTVPGRRLAPYWGRATELIHSAAAISLLPLILWSTGLLAVLRGLSS
ncbi:type VII secretion integral membrane protein EccD (plasmid) [Streptomyces sp. AHU1]|uniref:type VII secretion integral membrane protein EccD n=1 Tax=Streptomyces sp. AHU1 TaxID=3377215 RepID=UPI003877A78E